MTDERSATGPTDSGSRATSGMRGDAHATLAAFSRFQAAFAGVVADHGTSSPLEVRLHLAETAIEVARLGENLNLLAALIDLQEQVPTISSDAAAQMAAARRALRS